MYHYLNSPRWIFLICINPLIPIDPWIPIQMAKETRNEDGENVNFIFGGITCASGIVGVVSGAMWAKKWKERGNQVGAKKKMREE